MTAASSCPDVGSDFNVTSDVQSPYFVLFHQPETESSNKATIFEADI